ncbi:MAG: hypothetical protein JO029_11945 [Candidatus Eremiobacteraeota bacterium]|nr:hypothetical protein [Candidatus Eremiobacteraeota bacterium]
MKRYNAPMLRLNATSTIAVAFALTACSGGAPGVPTVPMAHQSVQSRPRTTGTAITEYPVPTGIKPRYITIGPGGIVWFGNDVDVGSTTSREVLGRLHGGAIQMLSLPAATQNTFMGFATTWHDGVWAVAVDNSIDEGQDYLVRANGVKAPALFPSSDDTQYWALAAGPDGRLWNANCLEACGEFPQGAFLSSRNPDGSSGPNYRFSNYYNATGLAAGPDGNLYAAVRYAGPPGPHDSYVYKFSTSGTVLQQILLPDGSNPEGITLGSDGKLWVTEPGTNQIARVTTSGAVTQFSLPAANAQPQQIAGGADGALWFAEFGADAIGRITTNGTVTQYAIPTPNAQPFGIASVTNCPGAHATLWFTEYGAGKIGKLHV